MSALFFMGAWLFVAPRPAVLHDRVSFSVEVELADAPPVDEIAVAGTDTTLGVPALAFESSETIDGGNFFVLLAGQVYCQILVVQHVSPDGKRVRGITKILTPDCAAGFPGLERAWRFRGRRV